jgi:integrase
MCFVDMAHLKKSDIKGNTIRYRRKKTGQVIELIVVPAMHRILERFVPLTAGSEYLFPIITNPKKNLRLQYESGLRLQNQRLKKIAAGCGIDKNISTHCARHSWATVAKSKGLPLAVISEGLGHANQKTTEIYLASLEQSLLDMASIVVSEAIYPQQRKRQLKI